MAETSTAVTVVQSYLDTTQRARRSQRDDDWQRVSELLADDLVVQVAADGTEQLWRELRGRASVMAVMKEARNTWSRLQTETVNIFGDQEQVLVEQVSTEVSETHSRNRSPLAFVFAVADGRITRIRRYGAERRATG